MNLIICFTPLQMLIAEKIIDKKELKNNILFVVTYTDNDKFRFYYNRLSEKCIYSYFFLVNEKNLLTRIFSIIKLKKIVSSLPVKKFDACYLASIDSSYIQLITSNVKFNQLYTFDDGTINIIKTSSYYSYRKLSFLERIFRNIFNITHSTSFYRKNSFLHYSVFDNENIISNVELISLIPNFSASIKNDNTMNIAKFFIGQPLSEINIPEQKLRIFIEYENINYYVPHPREKLDLDNVNYLITDKIFEEYLIDFIVNHPNTLVYVYTFFSSVVLTVKNIHQVKVIPCYTTLIDSKYVEVYETFKALNVNVRNIDNIING